MSARLTPQPDVASFVGLVLTLVGWALAAGELPRSSTDGGTRLWDPAETVLWVGWPFVALLVGFVACCWAAQQPKAAVTVVAAAVVAGLLIILIVAEAASLPGQRSVFEATDVEVGVLVAIAGVAVMAAAGMRALVQTVVRQAGVRSE